jgi:alkylhydroperoxidase/carboxymuconolactone decarboxylase family protein YurZ
LNSPNRIDLADLRALAAASVIDAGEGEPMSAMEAALLRLGLAVSVTSLDRFIIRSRIGEALALGASVTQVQEVVSLVSGLGVHSLMVSAVDIVEQAALAGQEIDQAFDDRRARLWAQHIGDDPFWSAFDRETPGFLRALLLLSPDQFVAFIDYCAVPWKSGSVRARLKELIAMASDATPTHRFLPGFKLHLANALALGAGRAAIMQALDIAAAAPPHVGTN